MDSIYKISDLVQWLAPVFAQLAELAGRQSGLALELRAEVGGAGVVQQIGYLADGQLTVNQQLFGTFRFWAMRYFSMVVPVASEKSLLRAL